MKRFDSEWPAVTVQWPHSADELINILQRALDQFDKGVGLLTGAETFARNVPTIIARIPEDRERAQALIPAMVRRLRNLEEHHRVVAISSFLLYSNCMIHADANYYAKDLGLEVPPVWAVLQSFDRLGVIFGEVKEEIMRVRIVKVDEIRIPGGFYISLPKRYEKGRYSAKKNDIEGFCRWIVPQLEYVANVELPSTYTGNWMFDKISGE